MRAALLALLCMICPAASAAPLDRDTLADLIIPPFLLGDPLGDTGVWEIDNAGGLHAGYAFETEPIAPLPGFSGAPINALVMLDLEGNFLDVKLIEQNEPIFVSGLGQAPFEAFFTQYRGRNIADTMVVGTPYGSGPAGGALVYLDGVTKATASVRIAHESVLAATLQIAREKMHGISTGPPVFPDPDHVETLTWDDLLAQGIARRLTVSNGQVDAAFADTLWQDDDPQARAAPDAPFLDLWIIDIGPPSIARAVLDADGLQELAAFLEISTFDEPLLLIETARHGLVSEDFVRNTSPDWLSAEQDGLPIALRDSDLLFSLRDDLPLALQDGVAMILRTDRRLGFNPARDWSLHVEAQRVHGMFHPEIGSVTFTATGAAPDRFFKTLEQPKPLTPVQAALLERRSDMVLLGLGLAVLMGGLFFAQSRLAGLRWFTPARLTFLAAMTGFVGYWGQGQLSIVTVLGVLRAFVDGGSLSFLLFDPFSLLLWSAVLLSFFLWGRALFCGWLCPFGALQEFAHHIGRLLRLPRWEPSATWDRRLGWGKYVSLGALVAIALFAPGWTEKAAEVEPFKTAITTGFQRQWAYVAYAGVLVASSAVLFKGFCRYLCPLGGVMALGGLLRGRDWIARRDACGSPCQLCKVRCNYGAIARTGAIRYQDCFGCLDCVTIHDDPAQCVPLIVQARAPRRVPVRSPMPEPAE